MNRPRKVAARRRNKMARAVKIFSSRVKPREGPERKERWCESE
jgi:hypothetical protein